DRLKETTLDLVADFRKTVIDYTTDSELKEKLSQLRYEIRQLEYKDKLTPDETEKLSNLRKEYREKGIDRHEFVHPYDAVVFLSTTLDTYKEYKFKITGNV